MICCVRGVSWIMDSIERLVRRNAFQLSRIFNFEPGIWNALIESGVDRS